MDQEGGGEGRPGAATPMPVPLSLAQASPPPLHGSVRQAGGEGAEVGGDHRIGGGEMVVVEMGREEWKEERKEEGASQSQREREAITPVSSRRWRGPDVKVN